MGFAAGRLRHALGALVKSSGHGVFRRFGPTDTSAPTSTAFSATDAVALAFLSDQGLGQFLRLGPL